MEMTKNEKDKLKQQLRNKIQKQEQEIKRLGGKLDMSEHESKRDKLRERLLQRKFEDLKSKVDKNGTLHCTVRQLENMSKEDLIKLSQAIFGPKKTLVSG